MGSIGSVGPKQQPNGQEPAGAPPVNATPPPSGPPVIQGAQQPTNAQQSTGTQPVNATPTLSGPPEIPGGSQLSNTQQSTPTLPFPRTDYTFDHISDPKLQAAALQNQNDLKDLIEHRGTEIAEMKRRVDRFGLPGQERETLTQKAKESVLEGVIEKGAEFLIKGAGNVVGAVGAAYSLGEILQSVHDERLLAGNSPEARHFQEQKKVIAVAEQMAPALTERDRKAFVPATENNTRDRLIQEYWTMDKLLNIQAGNQPRFPREQSTIKQR